MRSRVCGLVLAAGVALGIGLGAQTQAPRTAAAGGEAVPANSFILGQVVDAVTGQGIVGATVTLTGGIARSAAPPAPGMARGETPPQPRRVVTGAEGRFLFRDLTRGTYNASVTAAGYLPGVVGRRRSDGPGRPITIADNEKVTNASIRMWKFATIAGTVVDEANEPVVGLSVRVLRRVYAGGSPRLASGTTTYTDDRGAYRLASLGPGDYVVGVPSNTVTVSVASADEYRNLMMKGDAMAELEKMSMSRMESGAPMPSMSGMRVGDFQVQAGGLNRWATVLPSGPDGRLLVYPTVFYPGVTSATEATIVTVASGEQRSGVDLVLRPVPAARISGTLSGPDGPLANFGVQLLPADASSLVADTTLQTGTALTGPGGVFTFLGVPPGQYKLHAYRVPRAQSMPFMSVDAMRITGGMMAPPPPPPMPPPPSSEPSLYAELPVNVGEGGAEGLNLVLRPGPRVSGQIEFEGSAPRPTPQELQRITVALGGVDSRMTTPNQPTRPDATGRFVTQGYAPGRYTMNVSSPGAQWTIKSIMAGGVNLLERPLQLDSDVNAIVTFHDRPMELSGTVQGIKPDSDESYQVVLFPANYQEWIAQGMFGRRVVANPSANGTFQMRVPSPGNYLIVAVSQESLSEQRPEIYAALARVATAVAVAEGEKKSISIPVSTLR